jgi:D-alanine-D-alanine ligase
MKITVLTDLFADGTTDPVADQVFAALKQGRHKVSLLAAPADVGAITRGLARRKPDLVFNLLEEFGGADRGEIAVAGLLDALRIPYTGGGPGELFIRGNKSLAKKILAFDGVKCPDFAVFSKDADLETGGKLRMPLFVKPLERDASIGIGPDSLVRSATEMMERVLAIHKDVNDSALVEEYVEGREFFVGVLGNRDAAAFPPIEMDFSGLPADAPKVLDRRAKWDPKSPQYQGTRAVLADLPDELKARLQKTALDACRALLVRDYGRVDLRLTDTQAIYVIEVNANCYLERASEFATAALAHGLDYPAVVNRIVELAVERHQLAPRRKKKAEKV